MSLIKVFLFYNIFKSNNILQVFFVKKTTFLDKETIIIVIKNS